MVEKSIAYAVYNGFHDDSCQHTKPDDAISAGQGPQKVKLCEYKTADGFIPHGFIVKSFLEEKYKGGEEEPINNGVYPLFDDRAATRIEASILTVLEAAISDERQFKALKKLVTQTIWRIHNKSVQMVIAASRGERHDVLRQLDYSHDPLVD